MVYFLRPTNFHMADSKPDAMMLLKQNLIVIAVALVAAGAFILGVWLNRPAWFCDSTNLDANGKPTVKWGKTSGIAAAVAVVAGGAAWAVKHHMPVGSSAAAPVLPVASESK
jgi:hypothetical protein